MLVRSMLLQPNCVWNLYVGVSEHVPASETKPGDRLTSPAPKSSGQRISAENQKMRDLTRIAGMSYERCQLPAQ